jgi:hypothetical protein
MPRQKRLVQLGNYIKSAAIGQEVRIDSTQLEEKRAKRGGFFKVRIVE